MKYYTLLERDWEGRWCIAAGDYDREVMKYELEDCAASTGQPRKNFKIIATGDSQGEIDFAVAALNWREKCAHS